MLVAIGFGLFGCLFSELLRLRAYYKIQKKDRPIYFDVEAFWITLLIDIIFGVGFVIAYHNSGITLSPILYIHIGASGPLIANQFAQYTPNVKSFI